MRHAVCVAVLLLLSACVSFPPADPNQVTCVPKVGEDDPSQVVRPTGKTQIVRFTDDGEFVSRCELSNALYELQAPGPQIVVMYVHGWKHNGEKDDADLAHFNEQLDAIRKLDKRRVTGVYVAWNGKRTTLPLVKEFTFWGRKRAADRVSQSAAVTRLMGAIDSITEKRKVEGKSQDLVVYVGHSFGARVLYNAVAQVLIHRTQLRHPGGRGTYGRVEGIGDMVILLNPAFEASLFTTFNALHSPTYVFPPDQPPLVVSIASETDRATKIAFPFGQTISGNRAPKRRTTVGNFAPYWTHHLTLCGEKACLKPIDGRPPDFVPFLSVKADRTIIDGHNGIWTDTLRDFLAGMIGGAGAPVKASAP